MIRKQAEFPFLEEYHKQFPITDRTVFVYDDDIFTDYELPPDILLHEQVHIAQQKRTGAREWIRRYLADDKFRLEQEVEAYKIQVQSITGDVAAQMACRAECAENLSSPLYGGIISFDEAMKILS